MAGGESIMNESETRSELAAFEDDRMSPEMVEVYRRKTPTQRLQIAFDMWRSAQKIVAAAVKHQMPDATDEQRRQEVARRMSHGRL